MKQSGKIITKLIIALFIFLLFAYILYAVITWQKSKSPSDFDNFPRNGVWVATDDNFTITLDLTSVNEVNNIQDKMIATLIYDDINYNLSVSSETIQGNIINPVASSTMLFFKANLNNEIIHFSVYKYIFNENDFFFLDINLLTDNTFSELTANMNLYFFKQTNTDDCSYMIDFVGYEDIHNETIYLKNISFSNDFYKAEISGTIILYKTVEAQTYNIKRQNITFTQVYGHIWEASIYIENLDETIKIYASRAGDTYTGESKKIECGGRVMDAFEMNKYLDIKYLFINNIDYLKL